MDLFTDKVNRRIMTGNFPGNMLLPIPLNEMQISDIDLYEKSIDELDKYRSNPQLMYTLFMLSYSHIQELAAINHNNDIICPDVNIIINTLVEPKSLLFQGEPFISSQNMRPYITDIDKIFCHAVNCAYTSMIYSKNVDHVLAENTMYTWIYMLLVIQEKERESGLTINVNYISTKDDICGIIDNIWSINDCHYSVLSAYEKKELEKLSDKRNKLKELIVKERRQAITVAEKTQKDWELFIRIANDLSQKETDVINQILASRSPKEKLMAINNYDYVLLGLSKGRYELDGEEISMLTLLDSIEERTKKATYYCVVCTENEKKPILLHPLFFSKILMPYTYNYVYISFHHFRLAPQKETAYSFAKLALVCIEKNLGIENEIKEQNLSEMIKRFHDIIISFVKDKADVINRLSFDKLQDNAFASIICSPYEHDKNVEEMEKLIDCSTTKEIVYKKVNNLWNGKDLLQSKEELLSQIDYFSTLFDQRAEEAVARQLVISLNIIYMFCDFIRIILTNSHANIKVADRDAIIRYRNDLLRIDENIIHKVYAHLGDQCAGMLDYREQTGINPSFLAEQEKDEERYRNTLFSDILKENIEYLILHVDDQKIDSILNAKKQIREAILRFPSCDEKEQYSAWLDSISEEFCKKLIINCKQEVDSFNSMRSNIYLKLGALSNNLPDSSIEAMTSAELLFSRYANDRFANAGFDYSCISALYYQAFENAYNVLFWKKYADYLNNLNIQQVPYTSILDRYRQTSNSNMPSQAMGYLDPIAKNRAYYVKYGKPTIVVEHCMYKSFGILMNNIVHNTRLDKFCAFFASFAGFDSLADMFNDAEYMNICNEFSTAVISSAENRNNASHGGTKISIAQCRTDKKITIDDLETVRNNSIGLIQKLIFLLYSHK